MTSVLISIKPKWCELIASGIKTIEVRKTRPKLKTPFKCYIYETYDKAKDYYAVFHESTVGKVIGEFVCDDVSKFVYNNGGFLIKEDIPTTINATKQSCLTDTEFRKYAKENNVYGWHISNLKIYDEPKGLHYFFKPCGDCYKKGTIRCTEELSYCRAKVITRPPQSWCYVEEVRE